jgi:hypothetical protein
VRDEIRRMRERAWKRWRGRLLSVVYALCGVWLMSGADVVQEKDKEVELLELLSAPLSLSVFLCMCDGEAGVEEAKAKKTQEEANSPTKPTAAPSGSLSLSRVVRPFLYLYRYLYVYACRMW